MKRVKISLSSPDITQQELDAVAGVLRSTSLSCGPTLVEFEQGLAAYCRAAFGVGVSSGTAGLHLAVRALGIKEGDEVLTTPFSFVASTNCILYEKARPVFVDIDPDTYNLDPDLLEAKIGDRTRAILPVHVFGHPCEMDKIGMIAERYNLHVIEDACEALGAEYSGRRVGSLGDVSVFAFYPNKQITTGEGGMVLTDDPELARRVRSMRNHGRTDGANAVLHDSLGYNYRLDEMSAALGVAQLARVNELLDQRASVAKMYELRLSDIPGVTTPFVSESVKISWFVYVIRLDGHVDRNSVMSELDKRGIPTRSYFYPIHLQPYMRRMFGYEVGEFPVAEAVANATLALPFHGRMSETEVDYVCEALRDILDG